MKTGEQRLLESIDSNNASDVLQVLESLQEEVLSNSELTNWLITPANISMVYSRLVEELGVNLKAMQLRHRVSNRKRRALMFLKAMSNGVSRVV